MSVFQNLPKYTVLAVLAGGVAMVGYLYLKHPEQSVTVDVRQPELSAIAKNGKTAFDANCAKCHGPNASGTAKGPPLIHNIYNPGHHADGAFYRAVKKGARQHHWPYGNMPPQPQVNDDQIGAIVKYVRELQSANGITTKPHRM